MDFDFSPVESLDKVPEQFRSLYGTQAGDDGKFAVAESFRSVAEAVNGFNRSNKQLRNDLKTKVVDLSPLAEYGDNPATIKDAIKAAIEQAGANKNGDLQKQIDGVKQGLLQAHSKELEQRDQRNQALQGQLYNLLVENAATAAVAEMKGVPELLLPFIKQQVKVAEVDGQFKVTVVDPAGETRWGATGSPMTIKELVAEMKAQEKYGRLFESDTQPGNGGGGMRPGSGSQPPRAPQKDASPTGKIAAGLAQRARPGR